LGMIWSVSTSARSRWLTFPAIVFIGSTASLLGWSASHPGSRLM
jgi:hypothetical protein